MALDANKLSAARLWLITPPAAGARGPGPRGLAYLAHAVYAMIPVESVQVPRMACDEHWRLYVNPDWLDASDVPEVAAEIAHLTWHLLSDHVGRARILGVDRTTAESWATASDMPIATTLENDDLPLDRLPTADDHDVEEGRSAEEYFALLSGLPAGEPDPAPLDGSEGCGSGADGIPRSHELGRDLDVGQVTEFEARAIRERVAIEYRDHVRQRGTEPGDALRWVREVLSTQTPWEQVLRAATRRAIGWAAGRGDYTYSRPSRRAGSTPNIVLPGQHRPVPRVSIVVDTSGSVDDRLLARALGEIDGVIQATGIPGASVTVYSVDAAVHATTDLRSAQDVKLIGAGGTDMRIGLRAVEDERPRPDLVLVLTDGDTPWPRTPPPGTAVVVGLLGRRRGPALPPTPAWATRVECLLDDE